MGPCIGRKWRRASRSVIVGVCILHEDVGVAFQRPCNPHKHSARPMTLRAEVRLQSRERINVGKTEAWRRLTDLVEAVDASEPLQQQLPLLDEYGESRRAEAELISALDDFKEQGVLKWWNSTRLLQFRVTRPEVRVYARMPEKLEKSLGFTVSPAVDRIEQGLAVVMALAVGAAVPVLDKLPGPDIVRWFATAGLVSLPFVYIALGLSFPDALIAAVNQVLFTLNKDYKERLYRHEAGHFLAGYLCGLPVLSYSVNGRLNAVQFAGSQMGSAVAQEQKEAMGPMSLEQIEEMQRRGRTQRRKRLIDESYLAKLTVVSLAGVVAEFIRFGSAEGGVNDLANLQAAMDLANPDMSKREAEEQVCWGTLTVYSMIKSNERALEALMEAFERRASLTECFAVIEAAAGKEKGD